MTTYDENGGYPHPDHIMCHKVSVAAFEAAGDPTRYPDAGEPWQPLKLYYHHSFHRRADPGAARRDGRAAGWSRRTPSGSRSGSRTRSTTPGSPPGCRARSTSRSATGRCWRTPPRSTRTGAWFACPLDVHQEAWPTEDYELARSLVDIELPEDDLFAGIREAGLRGLECMNTLSWPSLLVPLLVDKAPDPDDVKPGWLGFAVFIALAVAVVLLWLSLRKQLKKVDFEEEPDGPLRARRGRALRSAEPPRPGRPPTRLRPVRTSAPGVVRRPACCAGCSSAGVLGRHHARHPLGPHHLEALAVEVAEHVLGGDRAPPGPGARRCPR